MKSLPVVLAALCFTGGALEAQAEELAPKQENTIPSLCEPYLLASDPGDCANTPVIQDGQYVGCVISERTRSYWYSPQHLSISGCQYYCEARRYFGALIMCIATQ